MDSIRHYSIKHGVSTMNNSDYLELLDRLSFNIQWLVVTKGIHKKQDLKDIRNDCISLSEVLEL